MSSKLEETDCQKHQATIDALKQVAREAQLKLSKKTKDLSFPCLALWKQIYFAKLLSSKLEETEINWHF